MFRVSASPRRNVPSDGDKTNLRPEGMNSSHNCGRIENVSRRETFGEEGLRSEGRVWLNGSDGEDRWKTTDNGHRGE